VTAAACAGSPATRVLSRDAEPSARLTAIQTPEFDRQKARLLLEVVVDNPGAAMTVHGVDFEVLLEGAVFATGRSRLQGSLAEGGETSLQVPVSLAYLGVPRRVRTRAERGEPVALVVRGALQLARAGEPLAIAFDGETEVKLPETEPGRGD
jgi:hypothetical protein